MADTVETAIYRLRVEGQAEIDRLTKSVDGLSVAEERATSSTRTFSQSLQNQVARIDPVIKAQEQYRKALEANARYRESGVGTEQQLNTHLAAATRLYQQQTGAIQGHTNATRLQRHELVNLSRQAQDIGVSLFSGQSPLTVLIQQGTQVADIFANSQGTVRGFFDQMAAGAAKFITPMNVAIVAITAATAATLALANAWDKVQVSSQRAISGAGARTGTTIADINSFVQRNAAPAYSGTGLSDTEARQLAEAFTRTGDIVIGKLSGMSEAVRGFANQTDKSITEAIQDFAKFGQDPVKGMEELSKVFGDLDLNTRRTIEGLAQAGDKTGAFAALMDAFSEKTKAAAENMSLLDRLSRGFWTTMGQEMVKPGGGPTAQEAETAKAAAEAAKLAVEIDKATKSSRDMLPVMEAVGGAQKMTAQYGADYANTLAQGHNAAVATAVAVQNMANAQAAVNASAKETLWNLQNQAEAASAVTAQQKIAAQQAATFNKLVHDNVDATLAMKVAEQEATNARKAGVAAAEQAVIASEQNLESIKAQGTEMEGVVAATQAYENAMRAGASATQAAAIYANTLEANLIRAARAADQVAEAAASAQASMIAGLGGQDAAAFGSWQTDQAFGGPNQGRQYTSVTDPLDMQYRAEQEARGVAGLMSDAYAQGGSRAALAAIVNAPDYFGNTGQYGSPAGYDLTQILGPQRSTAEEKVDLVRQLAEATGGGTSTEIEMLRQLPASVERDRRLSELTQAITDLTGSTNDLNATNRELLSPYYTMDPRTSHIGFRSQGMAAGGYVDVPGGYSANDNMLAMVPVASGERIYVDPNTTKRGGAGGQVITINAPVSVYGSAANKDDIGRSVYQNAQAAARQIAMASR